MASVYIQPRIGPTGQRFVVRYRLGGRAAPIQHAGVFRSHEAALKQVDFLRLEIAAGRLRPGVTVRTGREEFVYFARLGDLVKIGVSVAPKKRVHALNAELLHVEEGGRHRERELHEAFARLRVRGEWFQMDARIARYLESRAREPEAVSPLKGTES